jgi:hypothetical protein
MFTLTMVLTAATGVPGWVDRKRATENPAAKGRACRVSDSQNDVGSLLTPCANALNRKVYKHCCSTTAPQVGNAYASCWLVLQQLHSCMQDKLSITSPATSSTPHRAPCRQSPATTRHPAAAKAAAASSRRACCPGC